MPFMAAVPLLTVGLTAAGLGLQVAGSMQQSKAAKEQNAAQQRIIEQERRAEELRRRQMEVEARRRQMEMIRQQQRARALALATATSQGAAQGSGLQGGYGQISGQFNTQSLALGQNLDFGRQHFDINSAISDQRIAMANAGTRASFGSGLSSLGGSLMSAAPAFGRLTSGFSASYGKSTPLTLGSTSFGLGLY